MKATLHIAVLSRELGLRGTGDLWLFTWRPRRAAGMSDRFACGRSSRLSPCSRASRWPADLAAAERAWNDSTAAVTEGPWASVGLAKRISLANKHAEGGT